MPTLQPPSAPAHNELLTDPQWVAHPPSGLGLVFQLTQRAGQLQVPQASASAQMVCGLSTEALPSSSSSFVGCIRVADQPDFHALLQASALHGEPWNWEGSIFTEGEIRWINIRTAITRPGAFQAQCNGIMINISHARRSESDLRDMTAHMETCP